MTLLQKNFMVGLTVLVGLGLLAFIIVKFGDAPVRWIVHDRIPVEFDASRADGISSGSQVVFRGVNVGTVEQVTLDQQKNEVVIHALLYPNQLPPGNVVGKIHSQLIGGVSGLSLEVPEHEAPQGRVHANQRIPTEFVGISDVLPPEFTALAVELRQLSADIRDSHLLDNVNRTVVAVRTQVNNAGRVIDALQKTVGSEQGQQDLQQTLAHFRSISENVDKFSQRLNDLGKHLDDVSVSAAATLNKTQAHVDDVSKQINDRLEQVSHLLESVQSITTKIDKGQGTAGMLVNDPKLYESLVDTSRQLNEMIVQLKLYVEQVQQEGLYMKLTK